MHYCCISIVDHESRGGRDAARCTFIHVSVFLAPPHFLSYIRVGENDVQRAPMYDDTVCVDYV